MNKYISRVTSSARGEAFNPLVWPFFLTTFAFGTGFAWFSSTEGVSQSSLLQAMNETNPIVSFVWGWVALITIIAGFTFLLFNVPPIGKLSGIVGFMLWVYASICWWDTGGWLLILAIGIPNMWFWIWQYLSLSIFRKEDAIDKQTMKNYDDGKYDNPNNPDAQQEREDNRGLDTDPEVV